MTIQPRLVVTGCAPYGRSVLVADQSCDPVTVGAFPGSEFFLAWGTEDGTPTVGITPKQPITLPFFPGPGGTRLLFARYAPESSAPEPAPEPAGDSAALAAEVNEKLPGLMEVFEPGDETGMHSTDTLDYGICLEGELTLELDDGKQVKLVPGTCVVQQGTRHAWRNRGDKPALMCFVGIGAYRES
jgi:quercetin dioxygenase-like cupin family protein